MTLKEFKDLTKGMPDDAELYMEIYDYGTRAYKAVEEIEFYKPINRIDLC